MDSLSPGTTASDSSSQTASELHNASVDEDAALQGACAQVHLPTGSMCIKHHGHEGSCDFVGPGEADD
ncbi:MAG TPA: hypothetical protein VFP73_17250, partial [Terrabacter sp.]|nr:hypothetical protein [Terrabacter sp.]